MEPNFNLFVHNGNVYETVDRDTPDEIERKYNGPWPVRVWFTSCDCGDSHGWRRALFEKHGQVIENYLHDVGAGDTTQAVLMDIPSPKDFIVLANWFNLADNVPTKL